ncbi:MAG: hypothetical protein ACJASU_002214 [Cognaticolwellia sp.]|jgi:hypothetical protein
MHNYLNLVLHVDSEQVKNWTTLDVLSRWKLIMPPIIILGCV